MGSKERREREKEQRKNQILDVARALLLEKGLQATSINQIAKRSELSVGTFYSYYKSKEELYVALQQEGLDILYALISAAVRRKRDPKGKIRGIAQAYLAFTEEHKNYFDIINYFLNSSSEMFFSPQLKEQVDQHGNRIVDVMAGIIDAGIRSGHFREVPAKRYALILWGTMHGITQFRKLRNTILREDNLHGIYDEAVELFIEAISVAGVGRRATGANSYRPTPNT